MDGSRSTYGKMTNAFKIFSPNWCLLCLILMCFRSNCRGTEKIDEVSENLCFWDEFRTSDDRIRGSFAFGVMTGRRVEVSAWKTSSGQCWCGVQHVHCRESQNDLGATCVCHDTLSLSQHPSRNLYNHLSDCNSGRSLSSTLALESSLSLKTNCPKIVMAP